MGMHIGFSFQFQFTVVSDVNRLLRCEYMFVTLGIHCKYGCLVCQGDVPRRFAGREEAEGGTNRGWAVELICQTEDTFSLRLI